MAALVTFPTTRPRKSDTRWITKQKWLQIQNSGAVDGGLDQTIVYPDTEVRFHDTRLITLQKILQDQQSNPGAGNGGDEEEEVDPFVGTQYYIDTDVPDGGDGTEGSPWNNWRDAHIAAVNTALASGPIRLNLTGVANDTESIVQPQWNVFTNATAENYIDIVGDWPGGAWDESKYLLEITDAHAVYNNIPAFVRIRNIQIKLNSTGAGAFVALRLSTANVGVGVLDPECWFQNSIIWLNRTGGGRPTGISHSEFAEGDIGIVKNENIVIFDNGTGAIGVDGVNNDHCTHDSILADCTWYGFGTGIFKNCVAVSDGGAGGFIDDQAGTEYCASADASATGTGAQINQNFSASFTDPTSGNYIPLAEDESDIRDNGNTALTTDIRGLPRPAGAADDIGPFEYQ